MRFLHKFWIVAAVLVPLALAGCGLSLAGDVTPPPNYRAPTQPPEQPASLQTVYPLVPPDPSQGAVIYSQKCEQCHGKTGMGDGSQASQLPNPPAPIGSPDFARASKPVDWFDVVTNGNMQNFMPPFAQSLNDRQRWDVIAYVYTLSGTKENMDAGKAAYTANCAACHGEGGQGDGPQAASLSTRPVGWSKDESRLVKLSAQDIVNVMTGGLQGHPSFTDKLDDSQRYAVAAYVRQLSFSTSSSPEQVANSGSAASTGTPEAANLANSASGTSQPQTTPSANQTPQGTPQANIDVMGQVTNGTPGGKIPGGLKATLMAFNGMSPAFDQSADVTANGGYVFQNVKYDANYIYLVQVTVNGMTFNSDILHGQDIKGKQAVLPVKIFETTTDASSLRTDRLHVFFDFSKPGQVQVVTLFVITNPGDRVIIPPAENKPVLQFELPQGATNLQFQDGQLGDGRYIQTANGFGDAASIVPGQGQHQVLFAYDMPYTNKLDFNLKTPLPVDAAIVMVPPVGVKLKSSQLSDAGQQDVQGMSFLMYQSASSMKAGDMLSLSLSGKAGTAGSSSSKTPDPLTYILIGAGVLGAVLVGAGLWLYFHRRRDLRPVAEGVGELTSGMEGEDAQGESSESLLEAILALDDLHASGKLPDAAYQERRGELKARLADALIREKGG